MNRKLLIKNGILLDVETGERRAEDILIENGVIVRAEPGIETLRPEEGETVDAGGLFLTPGWIDAHAHVYYDPDETVGVSADEMAETGVTCVLDAGTAGPYCFEDFKERVIDRSSVLVKAYLHIGRWGVSKHHEELQSLDFIDEDACIQMCRTYENDILGLKVRIDPRVCCDELGALKRLRKLGDLTGKPIVVHASRSSLPMDQVLSYFRRGDIYAHTYAKKTPGVLDETGRVKDAVWAAKKRGVIFDLSHGNGNFSFEVARKALEQGFLTDTISTDLHAGSVAKVTDLGTTMTKMLHLGMKPEEIIRRVTAAPAAIMGLTERPVRLKMGQRADLTAFELEQGSFVLTDSDGEQETADRRFRTRFTVLGNSLLRAPF